MDPAAQRWVYEFGDFRLDTGRRVLSGLSDGGRIPLTPKVFDAALYLVERAGEMIPKTRLLSDLWPGVVVEENSLTQVICDLRRALGELRGENRYVVTVPRRGYQFVAEVSRVTGVTTAAAASTDRTVAVLAFESAGGHGAGDVLTSGIPQAILHRLSETGGLRLVARSVALALGGHAGDARLIGRRLGARYLVAGGVQRLGSRRRITVELIDSADGSQVWSMMFDGAVADAFSVEDDVARRVTHAVRESLLGALGTAD